MKTFFGCLLALLIITEAHTQQNTLYNLDFEQRSNGGSMPMAWTRWGAYDMSLDTNSYSGLYSFKIIGDTNRGKFGGMGYLIPNIHKRRMIRVEGYMKLKNVEDYAGLILRLDGKDEHPLIFSNMSQDQISGTRNWSKYSITLPYLEETRYVVIGGVLNGEGEVWFDNFSVYIDDVNILDLPRTEDEKSAELLHSSKEFDTQSFRKNLNYIWAISFLILLALIVLLIRQLLGKKRKQTSKRKKFYTKESPQKTSGDILLVKESDFESHGYKYRIIEALKKMEAEEEFLNANFTLSWVAKKIETNTTYLSQTVNQHYKKSFRDYTQDLRMGYVIRNIEENERFRKYSTRAMGESVGYKNPVSFSRAFKSKFGLTPSQYAERVNGI